MNEFIDLAGSCNPDLPCFSYFSIHSRLHGTFGNYIPLYGKQTERVDVVTTIVPFLELHNFESYPISWQLWRGIVGIETYWKFKKIFDGLIFSLGFIHESDHWTDDSYRYTYAEYGYLLSNEVFSSFEHVDAKLFFIFKIMKSRLNIIAIVGGKYFTRSESRKFKSAYNIELISKLKLSKNSALFASGYYEDINNEFESEPYGFYISFNKEPLLYRIVNFGLEFSNKEGAAFQIYKIFSESNGRGVDFVEQLSGDGFGIRFVSTH